MLSSVVVVVVVSICCVVHCSLLVTYLVKLYYEYLLYTVYSKQYISVIVTLVYMGTSSGPNIIYR